MIELKNNELVLRFPKVHGDAVCQVAFQRTLRIPDDNREYPLPPGLGRFPMEHVEDHVARLPAAWASHGGVLLPMYQAEALWISFASHSHSYDGEGYPFAIKVAAGKINAVTGEAWNNQLGRDPQDYVVAPDQPWLDGFCVQKGQIRQFVAMPLGQGYTAEEQLTGTAEHGGLQIIVYPMKQERYQQILDERARAREAWASMPQRANVCFSMMDAAMPESMGLAPGGLMRQEIYDDKYGLDAWDVSQASRCFVHILNSTQWETATGKPVPGQPPSAEAYTKAGLPWFDYYADGLTALSGSKKLAGLDSVAAKGVKVGEKPLPENDPITPTKVVPIGSGSAKVKEGNW